MRKLFLSIVLAIISISFSHAQTIDLVKEIVPGGHARVTHFQEALGSLYFVYGNDLWVTDGRTSNTILLKTFKANEPITGFTELNGWVYFAADDGINGFELWRTDGTVQHTALVKNINPGIANGLYKHASSKYQIKKLNGMIYFFAIDVMTGWELYKSDGTAAGTSIVTEIGFGGQSASPFALSSDQIPLLEVMDGWLYFSATPDISDPSATSLWSSDGTAAGTQPIVRINGLLTSMLAFNHKLYFTDGGGILYASDGTSSGTENLSFTNRPDKIVDYASLGDKLFFVSKDTLWVTRGTFVSTSPLLQLTNNSSYNRSSVYWIRSAFLTAFNNRMYFTNAGSLWSTDGSIGGEQQITTTQTSGRLRTPTQLIANGNRLYFKSDDTSRIEIWTTDGTPAGTYSVNKPGANFVTTQTNPPSPLVPILFGIGSPIASYKGNLIFSNSYDTGLRGQLYKLSFAANSVRSVPQQKVLLYPNPTSGNFAVQFEAGSYNRLTMTDQLGRIVDDRSIDNGTTGFEVQANLPAGVYFVRLSGLKGDSTQKILIQR